MGKSRKRSRERRKRKCQMSMEEFTVRKSCEKETSNLNAGVALQSIESVIEENARSIQGIPRTDAVETVDKMSIKVLKWPPLVSGFFPADGKRTLDVQMAGEPPSFNEFIENVKTAYDCTGLHFDKPKIYYHDGFEVMPVTWELDFAFCLNKFKSNYVKFLNNTDMNRIYVVINRKFPSRLATEARERAETSHQKSAAGSPEAAEQLPKLDKEFVERVKKDFPKVLIIEGNKFEGSCGYIGALNGKRRVGNIKRHVATTCRDRGRQVSRTLETYFRSSVNTNDNLQQSQDDNELPIEL